MDFKEFNSFLSSGVDVSDSIDEEALFKKIRASLSSILSTVFNDPAKQDIIERDNRLNFACPACGDSRINNRKKRGNIYYQGFNFKCWNSESEFCTHARTITSFLDKFDKKQDFTSAELAYLEKNTSEHQQLSISSSGVNFTTYATDMLGVDEFAIPRSKIMACRQVLAPFGMMNIRLVEIIDNIRILNYLKDRKQIPPNGDLRHFAYDQYNDNLYMFNLTHDREKVIGMQIRRQKLKNKKDLRFISYKYTDIWNKFFGVKDIKPEIGEMVDKYSMLYNILNVNYNKDIYIFEGGIDSHHLSNSIATLSAGTKIYLENGMYFYDNSTIDKAGYTAAADLLKKGYNVFLWGSFLKKYPQYRGCKDLNDIWKKAPVDVEILRGFFSNYSLDAIYL